MDCRFARMFHVNANWIWQVPLLSAFWGAHFNLNFFLFLYFGNSHTLIKSWGCPLIKLKAGPNEWTEWGGIEMREMLAVHRLNGANGIRNAWTFGKGSNRRTLNWIAAGRNVKKGGGASRNNCSSHPPWFYKALVLENTLTVLNSKIC